MRHSDQQKFPGIMNDQDLKTDLHDQLLNFAFDWSAKGSKIEAQIISAALEDELHLRSISGLVKDSIVNTTEIKIEPILRIDEKGYRTISPDMVICVHSDFKITWECTYPKKDTGFYDRRVTSYVLVELKTKVNVGETIRQLNYYKAHQYFFKTILICPPIPEYQVKLLNHAEINVVLYRK